MREAFTAGFAGGVGLFVAAGFFTDSAVYFGPAALCVVGLALALY